MLLKKIIWGLSYRRPKDRTRRLVCAWPQPTATHILGLTPLDDPSFPRDYHHVEGKRYIPARVDIQA